MTTGQRAPRLVRARSAPWLELGAAVTALLADLWWLGTLPSPIPSGIAKAIVLSVFVGSAIRRHRAGVKLPPPKVSRLRAWSEVAIFTLLASLLLIAVGRAIAIEPFDELRLFALHWPLADQLRLLLAGLARASMQQLILQMLLWAVIWEISRRELLSVSLAAAIFGITHLPHPALAGAALAVAWVWVWLYRRGRALVALILSHLLLTATAWAFLPERTLFDMKVGSKAVARAPNYGMFQAEENRVLLRRICRATRSGVAVGSEDDYIASITLEILGRLPTAEERRRWTPGVSRMSPCTAAKMLLMTDKSLARYEATERATPPPG